MKNGQKQTPEQHVSPLEVVCVYTGMLRSHSSLLLDCLRVFGERQTGGISLFRSVKREGCAEAFFFLS